LKFNSTEDRDAFITIWSPLGDYVKHHEPTTLAFELSIADTDPCMILVYERYVDKEEAFLKIHRSSPAFLKFKEEQTGIKCHIMGQSYYETGLGKM
jgi:quinol monooxygenase YgiN